MRRNIVCVLIARPADHKLSLDTIEACWEQNEDGYGIFYALGGRVVVKQGMTLAALLYDYAEIPDDQPMGIHLRWRTHGDIGMDNNHPFCVLSKDEDGIDLCAAHNGIIDCLPTADKTWSDTRIWVNLKVRPMLKLMPELLHVPEFQEALEDGIGGSRILFLDGEGNFTFLNSQSWTKHEGCWFSTRPPTKRSLVVGGYKGKYPANYAVGNYTDSEYGKWWNEQGYDEELKPFVKSAVKQIGQKVLSAPAKPAVDLTQDQTVVRDRFDEADIEGDEKVAGTEYLDGSHLYEMDYKEILELTWNDPEEVAAFLAEEYSRFYRYNTR